MVFENRGGLEIEEWNFNPHLECYTAECSLSNSVGWFSEQAY